MGSEASTHTYLEAGKHHGDTVAYKDEAMLASIGKHPNTITAIRIWWSDFVVGMETFYDGQSAGQHIGKHHHHGLVYKDLVLAPGEHIDQIYGRNGDLIDVLAFHTTFGRTETFGSSTGGHPFNLQSPGKVVKGFTCGFGGHLHFIGAHFGEPFVPITKSHHAGKTHGDTIMFDDYTGALAGKRNIRLSELRVLHDSSLVFGIEAIYEADGMIISGGIHSGPCHPGVVNQAVPIPAGVFITEIKGRGGDVMDRLEIKLSNGVTYGFGGHGGHPWNIDIPYGRHIKAFAGGHGGHIHNLAIYF